MVLEEHDFLWLDVSPPGWTQVSSPNKHPRVFTLPEPLQPPCVTPILKRNNLVPRDSGGSGIWEILVH